MRKFKAIAVDLDGTLVRTDGAPCPMGLDGLLNAESTGMHVVLATARNPASTVDFARRIGVGGPLISCNGCHVRASSDGPVWFGRTMDPDFAREVADMADERGWEIAITVGDTTFWKQRPGMPLGPLNKNRMVVATHAEMVTGSPIRLLTQDVAAVKGLLPHFGPGGRWESACKAETFTNPDGSLNSLVLNANGCDKGTALVLVCDRLGIRMDQVLAIGDNRCDVAMKDAGAFFAVVGNAEERVRKAADLVAPTNDDGGVGWVLGRMCG